MIKFSILLPTYNRLNKFRELIDYLKNEGVFSNPRIQVIASNNGSTDGTNKYIDSLNEPNLTAFNQKSNIGIIENFRFLIDKASGEYMWIMGDNDYYVPGTINFLLELLDNNKNCTHVFLNYGSIGGKSAPENAMVYHGKAGCYPNGLDMFYSIADDSTLGALMFISANIYRSDEVRKANDLIDKMGESDNLALPFGYSMFCCNGLNVCVTDLYVYDEMSTPSTWSDSRIKVYCRDIIAMYDCIAESFQEKKELRRFLLKHLPTRFPEYKYMLRGRKFGKDNYAMKFLLNNYPWKLILDIFEMPVYALSLGLKKIFMKEC